MKQKRKIHPAVFWGLVLPFTVLELAGRTLIYIPAGIVDVLISSTKEKTVKSD